MTTTADTLPDVVSALAEAVAVPPPLNADEDYGPRSPRWRHQSLSKGAAGVAVLHGVRAQHRAGGWTPVHAWLARATCEDVSAGPGAGLWFGAPALAIALHTAAPGRYAQAAAALDASVADLVRDRLAAADARIAARQRPSLSEFDLVRGLTGLGAYLLRRHPHGELLPRVLAYLVRLTEPLPAVDDAGLDAPGWWTSDVPPAPCDPALRFGHANVGMAHGIAGPLALLALAMRQHVVVDGHAAAMHRICAWLDTWRQETPSGPWWPERVTLADLRARRPHQRGPARPSWCYGTPGLTRAQQLAGIALADDDRQTTAEDALVRCLTDPTQLAHLVDPALCHGWAGVALTAWCAATDGAEHLAPILPGLVGQVLRHAEPDPGQLPGLIEGTAGVALTLHTIATATTRGWPTCLLLT